MQDVLIDVRGAQEHEEETAALLAAARSALPGARLIGLAPGPVHASVAAHLDAVRRTPGRLQRPTCFAQLAPWHDPLFVARLIADPAIPAVSVPLPAAPDRTEPAARLDQATLRHWHARYDAVAEPARLWETLAGLPQPPVLRRVRPRIALLDPSPDPGMMEALAGLIDLHVAATPLPALSSRFDRVIGVVANTPCHAPVAAVLARYGGACLLQDPGLPATYGYASALAEAEIGRRLARGEIGRWRAGDVRPRASFLGPLATTADPMLAPSQAVADLVAARFRATAAVVPHPVAAAPLSREAARAKLGVAGDEVLLAAELGPDWQDGCAWALDVLRSWGIVARLALLGTPTDWPRFRLTCRSLGVHVALFPRARAPLLRSAADVGLALAVGPGHGLAAGLAQACALGLATVATETVAMGIDAPGWVRTLPDETSPVLLAESILHALRADRPDPVAVQAFAARHHPARVAQRLCAALGL